MGGVPPILLLINIDHVTEDYIKRTPSPLEATLHNPWCAKDVSEEEEKVHDTFFIYHVFHYRIYYFLYRTWLDATVNALDKKNVM